MSLLLHVNLVKL